VAVIITHQKNIERLLSKKESKVRLFNKKIKEENGFNQTDKNLEVK
jgi:hypothetical protein